VWNHVWGYWWVAQCIYRGDLPIHSELLNWPRGGSLWFIDVFGAVTTLPVQMAWGPVAAYNASIWANFILCGIGVYVLAWRTTSHWLGSLLAGVCYMTSPHLLGQAYNGISETLSAGWFPLSIAAMREVAHDPTPKKGAAAGLAWAMTVLANFYYGVFTGIVLGGLVARAAWRGWERRHHGREAIKRHTRNAAIAIVVGVAVLGLTTAFPFSLFAASMNAEDAVVSRNETFVWLTLILHNMTDLLSMFHPGKFYSPDLKEHFNEDLIVVVYIGYALLVPAVFTLLTPLRRAARSWALFALGFGLLTLGPFLYVDGDYVQLGGGWIPLPFMVLFKWFPLFSRISHAYRFILGVSVALSVMAAFAVRAAQQKGVPAIVVVISLGTLRVLESFYGSPAVFPVPASTVVVPAVYAQLTGGAVLDLPVSIPVLARSRYNLYQLVHEQPVPYGLNDPTPPFLYLNRYGRYLIDLERGTTALLPARIPALDLELGREDLVANGLKWIVLHRDWFPAAQFTKVSSFLDITATPVYEDELVRVYRLDE
jgi:MFS family permease